MCCLITALLLFGPRFGLLVWWLLNPGIFRQAFDSFVLPLLGFLFLPWTTLAYLFVHPGGIAGLDWILLAIALLVDIGSLGGGAYGNRDRLRGRR